QIDVKTARFTIPVTISVDPQRLGVKVYGQSGKQPTVEQQRRIVDILVAHGLRAQLQTGNLLTGAKFVALDFFPHAPPFKVDWSQTPVRIATVPGSLEGIDINLSEIIAKLNKLPYQQIGGDLQKTLVNLNQTLVSAKAALDHADTMLKSNTGIDRQLINTLQEIDRAAKSLRVLSDYLERHPEALIRGKPEENKP
ncbi:MAG: mammalian cell entry protein, partial [Gammaproteobacteria bacterium]